MHTKQMTTHHAVSLGLDTIVSIDDIWHNSTATSFFADTCTEHIALVESAAAQGSQIKQAGRKAE